MSKSGHERVVWVPIRHHVMPSGRLEAVGCRKVVVEVVKKC